MRKFFIAFLQKGDCGSLKLMEVYADKTVKYTMSMFFVSCRLSVT